MQIKHLHIENFKCFEEIELNFKPLVLIIGPNASGKSNFIQIFKFLHDLRNLGLEDAIALQGGIEYFRNIHIGAKKNIKLQLKIEDTYKVGREVGDTLYGFKGLKTFYYLELKTFKTTNNFRIVKEELSTEFDIVHLKHDGDKISAESESKGKGKLEIIKQASKIKTSVSIPEGVEIQDEEIVPQFLNDIKLPEDKSILNSSFMVLPILSNIFDDMGIYDFDPKLPKKAIPIVGKTEIESDGSNIAIVLKHLLSNKNAKKRLIQYINSLLPFIKEPYVEKVADKSILMKFQEEYFNGSNSIPASLISDGTINITSIIIALFFSQKNFIAFEEPERNIHPNLISKLMNYMMEASNKAQIFLTTHNPELIKQTNLDYVYFISRDNRGMSKVFRPSSSAEVKTFLKNDIGIDELFVKNIMPV